MGKKSSKSSDKKKKNKGPKGKKARAKAKLDRQWGEEAVDTGRAFRKGKYSRLLTQDDQAKKRKDDEEEANEEVPLLDTASEARLAADSDSDSDKEEQEDDPMDLTGGAYAKLLKTIRSNNNENSSNRGKTKHARVDSEDENENEADSNSVDMDEEANDNDDEPMQEESSDEEGSVADQANNGNQLESKEQFDPFGDRFTQQAEPLPEEEGKREELLRTWHETLKVAVPHVDPMLELQVSKHLLGGIQLDPHTASKNDWRNLANHSFGCNREALKKSWNEGRKSKLSNLQRSLYPFVSRYADCLITTPSGSDNNSKQRASQISSMTTLHIANHVLTSRGRIQRLNRKLKAAQHNNNTDDDDNDQPEDETVIKDQGYTRPTVLVLLPTRGTCHKFVQTLLDLIGGNVPEEYRERFETEYGPIPRDDGDDEDPGTTDEALRRRRKRVLQEKGASWLELFGDQTNDDDDFKIGIALNTKAVESSKKENGKKSHKEDTTGSNSKVNVKLYTDFYSSDIIVCSPLGLKMAMASDSGEGDADFLSSIEICLLDHADVLMMQNWDHVNSVLDRVNELPQKNNETDFSRVRNYFLVDQACHWRQMILLTEILDPTILSTFKRFAKSKSGIVKTRRRIMDDEGCIAKVIVPVQQVFQRVPVQSLSSQGDDRMKYMTHKILPPILQHRQKRTLIYIPSYFDFVMLRNYLIKKEFDFVTINEYSRVSETSRGRARFLQGRKPLMLYTGRAHFFLRHKIKGVRNLIFFGLPEHPEFYVDMVNVINEGLEHTEENDDDDGSGNGSIALFTKYEAHALERIVGTKQTSRMVKGEKPTFVFFS